MLLLALACTSAPEPYALVLPEGFPEPPVPVDNPLTEPGVELGRTLFYDDRLSENGTQSCSSCHLQELAFTDGLTTGVGSTGEVHPRNANGLSNVAYNSTLTWANPNLVELETQLLLPLFGDAPVELNAGRDRDGVLQRIADDPELMDLYDQAFPAQDLDWDHVVMGLSQFTRTLITGDSPFDRFAYQGQDAAMSEAALRGMSLFFEERLECHHCHGGFNFSEATRHADSPFDSSLFQNTGLYDLDGNGAYPADNTGLFEITGDPADMGRFRAPSLRNVAVTAPYMHDGSVETLEEVIRIYENGGRGDGANSPLKSGLVPGFELTDEERSDLIAFLESLTDETFLTDPALAAP